MNTGLAYQENRAFIETLGRALVGASLERRAAEEASLGEEGKLIMQELGF